jgi:hypothetical protein
MCRRVRLAVASVVLLASCGVPKDELPPFGPIEQPLFGRPSMQGVYVWNAPASHDRVLDIASTGKAARAPKQLWLKESSLAIELRWREINPSGNAPSSRSRDWHQVESTKSRCTAGLQSVGVNTRLARMRNGSLAVGVVSSWGGQAESGAQWSWAELRKVGEGDAAPEPIDASVAGDDAGQPAAGDQRTPLRPDSVQAIAASMSLQRQSGLLAAAAIAAVMLFFAAARRFGMRPTFWAFAGAWLVAVASYYLARLGYYGGAALMMLIPATFALGLPVLLAVVIVYRVYAVLFFAPRERSP